MNTTNLDTLNYAQLFSLARNLNIARARNYKTAGELRNRIITHLRQANSTYDRPRFQLARWKTRPQEFNRFTRNFVKTLKA